MQRPQYVPPSSDERQSGERRSSRGGRGRGDASGRGRGGGRGGGGRGRGGGRGGRGGGGPNREGWRLELAAITQNPDEAERAGVVFLREAVQVEVVKGSGEQQQRKRTKRDGEQPGGKSEATVSGASGEARSDGAEGGMRTEEVLVIYDKMPKARRHMLVLPLREIDSPQTLKRFHLPVLRALHATALKTVAMLQAEDPSLTFRIGYHAIPTLQQLHLHVVSEDFDSRCMNRELRWNSFTTPFFIPSTEMMAIIERDGKFDGTEYKRYLRQDIVCFRCQHRPRTFDDLKSHIATCLG